MRCRCRATSWHRLDQVAEYADTVGTRVAREQVGRFTQRDPGSLGGGRALPRQRTRPAAARKPTHQLELVFLPGLAGLVEQEATARLPGLRRLALVPGREDALWCELAGPLAPVLELRTVVAPFLVRTFPVRTPKLLLGGDHFPALQAAIRSMIELNLRRPPQSLRIEAAGSDTAVMRNLATQLAAATGLRHDPERGECTVRLRRTPGGDGWDVLVRLSPLPLSARPWRVQGHPAAANATVAAAMALLTGLRPEQRVANVMCGSGTLLIERLLAGPARMALGVDCDPDAVRAARRNADAARVGDRIRLVGADVRDDAWLASGPYDVLLADPPWGDKAGRHAENEALHAYLLDRAYTAAAPHARLLVLTHEIRIMERCVAAAADRWRLTDQIRVFHKGHHPRIYILDRTT